MKDQYNNPVPSDLVLLDNSLFDILSSDELQKVGALDWYKPEKSNSIFVSAAAIDKCFDELYDFYGPEEFGLEKGNWLKIDACLHRWSHEDGFYHW